MPPSAAERTLLLETRFHQHRLALAFAALRQPGRQTLGKTLRREAKAHFNFAIRDGQRVVKFRCIREVAHAELVEPFKWTRPALSANHDIDEKLLRIH
jgi:hypothetical protein